MQAPRLNEVLARVVAWHNRHPLARRISASQVHSIGEVLLPFASAQAVAAAEPAPPLPHLDELLAAQAPSPPVARFDELVRRAAHPDAAPADAAAPLTMAGDDAPDPPAAAAAPAGTDDGPGTPVDDDEAALEMPLAPPAGEPQDTPPDPSLDDVADESAARMAAGGAAGAPDTDDAALALAEPREHNPDSAPASADTAAPGAAISALAKAIPADLLYAAPATAQPAAAPAAAPVAVSPGLLTRLRAWLKGVKGVKGGANPLPRLQPAFSLDFIWPLSPRQVARFARRHGQVQPVAPADWPRRVVDTDKARLAGLRQRGLAHSAPLHVLTAAIGVGDRRIRVLLGADGAVLGPRAYSRARLGIAGALLATAVLGAAWTLRHPAATPDADHAGAAAAVASAPLAPASAASAPAPAPASASAAAAASAAEPAASAVPPGQAAPELAASASQPAAAQSAGPAGSAAPHEAAAAPPGADSASAPPADIRPPLSAEARQAAREQGAALRGEPRPARPEAAAAASVVYAVVSLPQPQREAAMRTLKLMRAAGERLQLTTPDHGELMNQQGAWRAAWWPFTSLADAERARVLLAGRGVKAEVVEF